MGIKPKEVQVRDFTECMKRRYNFKHTRLKSGGSLLESSDDSARMVLFTYSGNTLDTSQIHEILEALDFSKTEAWGIANELTKDQAIPQANIDEGMKILKSLPRGNHVWDEETLQWMDEFFKKLDAGEDMGQFVVEQVDKKDKPQV